MCVSFLLFPCITVVSIPFGNVFSPSVKPAVVFGNVGFVSAFQNEPSSAFRARVHRNHSVRRFFQFVGKQCGVLIFRAENIGTGKRSSVSVVAEYIEGN